VPRVPEQLVDRILREIRERLAASREAYEESQRLEAALEALGTPPPRSSAGPGSARSGSGRGRSSARAARGENVRRIREAVAERPGASAGEIAAATAIARATVASTLAKLAREGELEKTELPSGRVGYRPSSGAPAVDSAPVDAQAPATPTIDPSRPTGGAGAPVSETPAADAVSPEPTPRARKPRPARSDAPRPRRAAGAKPARTRRASTPPPANEPSALADATERSATPTGPSESVPGPDTATS